MSVFGTTTKNYISSLNFMDYPELLRDVLDVTNEEMYGVMDIMDLTGRLVKTDAVEYEHFTNKHLFKAGVIDTSGIDATNDGTWSGAACKDLTVTVTDAAGMPVVGELVQTQQGTIGYVKSLDSTVQFTAQALDTATQSYAINDGNLAAGQSLVYFTYAGAEGTTDPAARRPSWKNSKNYVQIFKESGKITEIQKVVKIQVNYGGKPYVMYKLQNDTLKRFKAKIAYGLLAGRKSKFTDPVSGEQIWTTQGLTNYIQEGDGSVNTTGGVVKDLSGSTIALSDIKTVSRSLDKKGAPKEYWLWLGGDLAADLDDVLSTDTRLIQGGILYNSFGKSNAKQKAVDLGIDSFKIYNRTWHKKIIDAYDHPEVFGATGFTLSTNGFAIPTGKIKIDHSSKAVERLRVRYLEGDGVDLRYLETLTGKLAPVPTSTESALTVSYESVMGLEVLGNELFVLFEG